MTITINVWPLLPLGVALFGIGVVFYERGQCKGLEIAEKLYEPLMKRLESILEGEDRQ